MINVLLPLFAFCSCFWCVLLVDFLDCFSLLDTFSQPLSRIRGCVEAELV